MDENKQYMHNSMGFRRTEKKGSAKFNNSLMKSNKKIDNKNITSSSNTKLLYEKIKKKTYTNNFKKSNETDYLKNQTFKFSGTFKKRESLPSRKIGFYVL